MWKFALVLCACLPISTLGFYSGKSPVVELTPDNFQKKVGGGGVWLVEFYAPWCGHCKSLTSTWEQIAGALAGVVNVGAVDADQHKSLGSQYSVKGFPTIKFFYKDASGSLKSLDYGGGRTATELVNYAFDKAKAHVFKKLGVKDAGGPKASGGGGSGGGQATDSFYTGTDVVVLTDSNFKDQVQGSSELWFVEFYAPWCGHCKNLKPAWIEAARDVKGKVKLGAVDCTAQQEVCMKYKVQGYPTIKFFDPKKSKPEDYQGDRSASGIVTFALEKWKQNRPPPEVVHLTSLAVFQEHCLGDGDKYKPKTLCLLAFLPDILDTGAAGRQRYIQMVQKLADADTSGQWTYLWAEGGSQSALEANFGVGGAGYPALVAFNPGKLMFANSKTAFEVDHLKDFVSAVQKGGIGVSSIYGALAEVSTIEPWDGKEPAVQVEDEFSLDDIMNEEL